MAISFNFVETKDILSKKNKIKSWIKSEVEKRGMKVGDISYIFCKDEYLLNINKTYLNHDYFTDIIKLKGQYGKHKWPKLEETMQFLNINTESKEFNEGLQRLYGDDGISFHDARFDVAGLITVYYKAMRMGYKM